MVSPDSNRNRKDGAPSAKITLPSTKRARPVVMLVEDDPKQLLRYKRELNALGFDTLGFKSSLQALKYLCNCRNRKSRLPNIVLTDRQLRGDMYGDLLALRIREEGFKMPIFLHTLDSEYHYSKVHIGDGELITFLDKYRREETYQAMILAARPTMR